MMSVRGGVGKGSQREGGRSSAIRRNCLGVAAVYGEVVDAASVMCRETETKVPRRLSGGRLRVGGTCRRDV
jgi:ribosomal protein L27